jgi:hypothetical protein
MDDLITAENVEKLRNFGLYWKHSSAHPDSNSKQNGTGLRLWVKFDNKWYYYYSIDLMSFIKEFDYCNNSDCIKNTINKLLNNNKLK